MANPFQQKVRFRKISYAVAIVALFTISLIHKGLGKEPPAWSLRGQANNLQLRESARGDVELTSSAVRLVLTGSRGLATTILWAAAIKKQEVHEWNEVELLVNSITKLQPYFVTPWLFQSWNLAFNVSVECDRPRDKYYYVSRGIQLLGEGERRNFKEGYSPGNPDMRYHIGFTYQLKMGTSDEKNAMRSLLDMSMIDPVKRDPRRMWVSGPSGKEVDEEQFRRLCRDNPRLVRRLHDYLRCDTPDKVVRFLEDNREVPSRFEIPDPTLVGGGAEPPPTPLKPAVDQFPLVPPPGTTGAWPDPKGELLTREESPSVYYVSRSWFQYAMIPLPPEVANPGVEEPQYDPTKNRIPRRMSIYIFRGYPARAQSFMGEILEEEGFFDQEGWTWKVKFKDRGREIEKPITMGTETIYHARPVWEKAYQMYLDYGIRNGLFITPEQREAINRIAQPFRDENKLSPGDRLNLPPSRQTEGAKAHMKLAWNEHYRQMTNYDAHLAEARAQRTPLAILAQKYLFKAKYLHNVEQQHEEALVYYNKAWPLWHEVLFQNPVFRQIGPMQEDIYELQLKYLRLVQRQQELTMRNIAMAVAQLSPSIWPYPNLDKALTENDKKKIMPIRTVRGPTEMLKVYEGSNGPELGKALYAVLKGASILKTPVFFPGHESYVLVGFRERDSEPNPYWLPLLEDGTVQRVRDRLMGPRPTAPAPTVQTEEPPVEQTQPAVKQG